MLVLQSVVDGFDKLYSKIPADEEARIERGRRIGITVNLLKTALEDAKQALPMPPKVEGDPSRN